MGKNCIFLSFCSCLSCWRVVFILFFFCFFLFLLLDFGFLVCFFCSLWFCFLVKPYILCVAGLITLVIHGGPYSSVMLRTCPSLINLEDGFHSFAVCLDLKGQCILSTMKFWSSRQSGISESSEKTSPVWGKSEQEPEIIHQSTYPLVIKRGLLENPRTKWRFEWENRRKSSNFIWFYMVDGPACHVTHWGVVHMNPLLITIHLLIEHLIDVKWC